MDCEYIPSITVDWVIQKTGIKDCNICKYLEYHAHYFRVKVLGNPCAFSTLSICTNHMFSNRLWLNCPILSIEVCLPPCKTAFCSIYQF